MTTLGVDHISAMILRCFSGALLTFMVNRFRTFNPNGIIHKVFVQSAVVDVLGYLLTFMFLSLGADYLHCPHQGIQAMAIGAVAAIVFLMHKYWVFRQVMGKEYI